jgi:cytochrome P450
MASEPPGDGRVAPGPRGGLLFGSLGSFRRDPIAFFLASQKEHGDVVRLRLGSVTAHLVCHPRGVRHVLQTHHLNYSKNTRGIDKLRGILGNGLLTSDGAFWRRQRLIAQPAFHRERIATFAGLMSRAAAEMLDGWQRHGSSGPALDIAQEMMAVTLRIVAEASFGAGVEHATRKVGEALSVALHLTNRRVKRPFDLPSWLPTPGNLRFRRAMRTLDGVVADMVAGRRRLDTRDDLLSMLMQARDAETGEGMSDRQLRDEVMTVFLAGHETTANALTWAFYLLSRHAEAEAHLHEEVDRVLRRRPPTLEDVGRLPYTTMVIQETMRLYPPAWLFGRSPTENDQIDGYRVATGSLVFLSPYVTHRHPDFWPDPERFLPDRFEATRAASIDRFAYFPFGGGPRLCIGAPFAMLEMPLVLASVAQRYRLRLVPGYREELEPLVTLRPRHGMPMTLTAR